VNSPSKLLLAAALLLGVVGIGLAILRPGELGDDASTETAQPGVTEPEDTTTTSTTAVPTTATMSPTTAAGDGDGETSGAGESDTTTTSAHAAATSTTPAPPAPGGPDSGARTGGTGGTGIDGGTAPPADLADGLADTGGTSLLGAAMLLALAGLVVRHRIDA
jgi:hypothetical protein